MSRIKRVSQIFRLLFIVVFFALPVLLALFWINAHAPLGPMPILGLGQNSGFVLNFIPWNIQKLPLMHELSIETKFFGFLISLIPEGIHLLVLYWLIKLFGLYEQGEIFSLANVKYIRNLGYTLLVGQVLNPIYDGLMSLNLMWGNPPGHRYATFSFGSPNVTVLATAFLVILISWVMAEGYKLREEQTLTI